MKCSACAKNECEGKYENRHKCLGEKEGIECSCYCRRTKGEVFFSSLLSIGTGVAVAAAGISLTVATGGIAAVVGGAAIAGGGTSLVMSPIQKLVTGDCVTFTDSVKEVALGATIGAVTGPIGALGSTASKGATVAVKIGARMVAGSAAGATSGAISEGVKKLKGEEVSWESFGKSVAIGAVAGTVGGASTSIAHSSVCKPVADVIGRPATRVITQAATSMATDAGVQLATTGEIDPKLMLANTTGQVVCGVTAEAASSLASSGRQDKQPIKESNNNDRPDKPDRPSNQADTRPDKQPDIRPDHQPSKNQDNFDFGDKKHGLKSNIDFNKVMDGEILKSVQLTPGEAEKLFGHRGNERANQPNVLDQKPFKEFKINKNYIEYKMRGRFNSPAVKQIKQMQMSRFKRISAFKSSQAVVPKVTHVSTAPTNYLLANQLKPIIEPVKYKNQDLLAYTPEELQCIADLLDSRKSHEKGIISRESVARALEILRNTNDPELYGALLQYNIPLDMVGLEATRLMLEQIYEVSIKVEVTFDDDKYVFGEIEGQESKVIQLDLIDSHFINEIQDGASANYYDCLYYAIAKDFPDILDMTPDEMRRNISDVIKNNEHIKSIISNGDHSYFIDIGFYGGREARRELEEARNDPEAFWERILELLKNPEGRDHSYNAIDQDFYGRFDALYKVPLEIDHVLPVSIWVGLFVYLKQLIKSGRTNTRLLRMLQILTGVNDLTNLTVDELKSIVKRFFPCIILTGLVHRNLLTTCYSNIKRLFWNEIFDLIANGEFEKALKMIFQDQHNTTIHIREQFPDILYSQTLLDELELLHLWQRSLVDYYLRLQIIDEQQANFLYDLIDSLPLESYDEDFKTLWKRSMTIPGHYVDMYIERDLIPENEEHKDKDKDKEDKEASKNKKTN